MTLLLLVRHAVTDVTGVRLYGRSTGIGLSDAGREQVRGLVERTSEVPLDAVYSSPLERCLETAGPVAERHGLEVQEVEDLIEIDYGRWTGRPFTSLRRMKLWQEIHGANPSAVRFPGGETLAEAQVRVKAAVDELVARHPKDTIAVVSHGDPISLLVASFAGVHVDLFQRIEVAPASVSAISVGTGPPRLRLLNETGSLAHLARPKRARRRVRG